MGKSPVKKGKDYSMSSYTPSEVLENHKRSISENAKKLIKSCEEKIDIIVSDKPEEYMPLCEQLLVCAIEEQSDYLFACAYYYMMLYYVRLNDWVNGISCGLEGLKYQRLSQDIEKAACSFSVLGNVYDSIGDTSKAIDNLLCSIDLASKYNIHKFHFIAANNISKLFFINTNYERALHYFAEAEKYFHKTYGDEHSLASLNSFANLMCNMGNCLISISKLEEANACADNLIKYIESTPNGSESYPVFIVNTFLANLALANGDNNKMNLHLQAALNALETFDDYINHNIDILMFIDLNILLKNYDDVTKISEHFINTCKESNAPFNITSRFMEKRIDCAILLHDDKAYAHFSKEFYEDYKQERNRNSEQTLKAENSHYEQIRLRKRQQILLEKSQHDTLTGLPNRAYLNTYAEETLAKAIQNNTYFGIEILDIDYFKHINDSYGHMEGDRYLKNVAALLKSLTNSDDEIFAARYGGDEFVIVYYNKTSEDIRYLMSQLKLNTTSIKLPKESAVGCKHLTLSQGCFNKIAGEGNRLWDYLSIADVALYEIKEKGRNSFLLKE